eukprot:g25614.t1
MLIFGLLMRLLVAVVAANTREPTPAQSVRNLESEAIHSTSSSSYSSSSASYSSSLDSQPLSPLKPAAVPVTRNLQTPHLSYRIYPSPSSHAATRACTDKKRSSAACVTSYKPSSRVASHVKSVFESARFTRQDLRSPKGARSDGTPSATTFVLSARQGLCSRAHLFNCRPTSEDHTDDDKEDLDLVMEMRLRNEVLALSKEFSDRRWAVHESDTSD